MKAQWIDGQYGFYYLHVDKQGQLRVTIGWDSTVPKGQPTGYKVSFAGYTLVKRYQSLEEAKQAGEALAKRILIKALANLS